jgi:uncharacterized membrane protein
VPSTYNRIAGRNLDRLIALSDGVFSVAMTLLVLDLRAPAYDAIHSERELLVALAALSPRLGTYMMSFLTLGIFWVGQAAQLDRLERGDRDLAWIHIGFLFAVTLVPFSTALLAEHIVYRSALVVYWLNILLLGMILLWTWRYAMKAHLVREDTPPEVAGAIERRIVRAQMLYALGAALCVISTTVSIVFIGLVQLNYALALADRWFSKE